MHWYVQMFWNTIGLKTLCKDSPKSFRYKNFGAVHERNDFSVFAVSGLFIVAFSEKLLLEQIDEKLQLFFNLLEQEMIL